MYTVLLTMVSFWCNFIVTIFFFQNLFYSTLTKWEISLILTLHGHCAQRRGVNYYQRRVFFFSEKKKCENKELYVYNIFLLKHFCYKITDFVESCKWRQHLKLFLIAKYFSYIYIKDNLGEFYLDSLGISPNIYYF